MWWMVLFLSCKEAEKQSAEIETHIHNQDEQVVRKENGFMVDKSANGYPPYRTRKPRL